MPIRPESEIKAEYDRAKARYENEKKRRDNNLPYNSSDIALWAGKTLTLEWVLGLNPEKSKYG